MELEVLTALSIGLFTLVVLLYFLFRRSGAKRPNIIIAGLCDSGKTLLFTQLTQNVFKMTHTSLKENRGIVSIRNKEVSIIDVPGYERLRHRMMEKYASTAKAIIFAVDSVSITKEIKDVAEYLYMLLTDADISRAKVPILIACNKQDIAFTKSCTVIKSLLEKELNTVRRTRAAGLDGTDGSSSQRCQLGDAKVDFEFGQLRPQRVEVVECSAKGSLPAGDEPELNDLTQWLQTV